MGDSKCKKKKKSVQIGFCSRNRGSKGSPGRGMNGSDVFISFLAFKSVLFIVIIIIIILMKKSYFFHVQKQSIWLMTLYLIFGLQFVSNNEELEN